MVYVRLQGALPPYIYEYNKKMPMEYITGKYFFKLAYLPRPAPGIELPGNDALPSPGLLIY